MQILGKFIVKYFTAICQTGKKKKKKNVLRYIDRICRICP